MPDSTRTIEVALFAAAKALAETEALIIQVPVEATAGDVLQQLGAQCPSLQGLLPACRLAVDLQYVSAEHRISGDEQLALIPPVSGG